MRLGQKRATLWLLTAALAVLAGSAGAKPAHHATQSAALLSGSPQPDFTIRDEHNPYLTQTPAERRANAKLRTGRHRYARAEARVAAQSHAHSAYGGFSNDALVAEARRYIGTNPTGRSHLWCGAFMDMILKETGHKGGGNLALGYEHYGHRVAGPVVGAIAVMSRHGGGHVGVVSGIDANGNPIIISGNHNHTVAEAVYPRSRIAAYVMPGS
jgi:uncharacterized protein (TIGR02594 family)